MKVIHNNEFKFPPVCEDLADLRRCLGKAPGGIRIMADIGGSGAFQDAFPKKGEAPSNELQLPVRLRDRCECSPDTAAASRGFVHDR